MFNRMSSKVAVVLLCLITGCVAVHRGRTEMKWDKGATDARVLTALNTGEYGLYSIGDAKPKLVLRLQKGDALGFERDGKKVTAIAGEHRLSFADDTYYWNFRGK
jgi:hypothetical protein